MPQSINRINGAVERTVKHISRGRPVRRVISRKSEENLLFAVSALSPQDGRALLKGLRSAGQDIHLKKVVVPWELGLWQNRPLAQALSDPARLKDLVIKEGRREGWLDLRGAGLSAQAPYRDLTEEFIDYQTLNQLWSSFQGDNRRVIEQDREIRLLTLYSDVWTVRTMLYQAGEMKSAGKRDGDSVAWHEGRAAVGRLGEFLADLAADYPFKPGGRDNEQALRKAIWKAAGLLRDFNNTAADAVLVSVTGRLENGLEALEKDRLTRQRRSKKRPPGNILEEELVHLAQRRYKIAFGPDGSWILPQAGFRKVGPVRQRQIINHRVEAEAVVRREQHRIDDITGRIAANHHHQALLDAYARRLRSADKADYEQLLDFIGRTYLAYARGEVRAKFKTALLLRVALQLVRTASVCREEASERRLRLFAGAMMDMAAGELVRLNENLGGQIRRIAVKQRLEMEIMARNLAVETNLRTLSETLLTAAPNPKMMNSVREAGRLRQLCVDAARSFVLDEQLPPGFGRARARLEGLAKLLAKSRRLVLEKDAVRKKIARVRRRFRDRYRELNGSLDPASAELRRRVDELRQTAVETVRAELTEIRAYNREINKTLNAIAAQALLVQHDMLEKFKAEDSDSQFAFLGEHSELMERVADLDRQYQMVYGRHGEELGEASPFDIWKLDLRTAPPQT